MMYEQNTDIMRVRNVFENAHIAVILVVQVGACACADTHLLEGVDND